MSPPGRTIAGQLGVWVAEPLARIASRSDASGADVLLATKLYVPRPQPGFVPRPRLTAQLDEGLAPWAYPGLRASRVRQD